MSAMTVTRSSRVTPQHCISDPTNLGSVEPPNEHSHQVRHVYNDRVRGLLGAGETESLCDEHVNLVA